MIKSHQYCRATHVYRTSCSERWDRTEPRRHPMSLSFAGNLHTWVNLHGPGLLGSAQSSADGRMGVRTAQERHAGEDEVVNMHCGVCVSRGRMDDWVN